LKGLRNIFPVSEYTNYDFLLDGHRNDTNQRPEPPHNYKSLGPGWFRFQGDAGTKMTTTCVPYLRCGTDAPGWLDGDHPAVADGTVTRSVCFSWKPNCCVWSINIQVRNCGDLTSFTTSAEHRTMAILATVALANKAASEVFFVSLSLTVTSNNGDFERTIFVLKSKQFYVGFHHTSGLLAF